MSSISLSLVSFINADNGDKAVRAEMRTQAITAQVVKCLKGNATEYRAGRELALSLKTKTGRAWAAGFAAIAEFVGAAEPARYAYTGKLTPEVAEAIEAAAEPIVLAFLTGFEAIAPTIKAEPTAEELAAAEVRKQASKQKAEEKALAAAAAKGMIDNESHMAECRAQYEKGRKDGATMTTADLIGAVCEALTSGALDEDEIMMLRAALSISKAAATSKAPAMA